jgi:hypothetical protein
VDSFVQLRASATGNSAGSVEVIDPDGRRPLSLSEARAAQSVRLERAGFYQIRFASGRDAVIGVNPDRRESDLQPMPRDLLELWSGSSANAAAPAKSTDTEDSSFRNISLWWYVMLFAFAVTLAEMTVASDHMGTQREEA